MSPGRLTTHQAILLLAKDPRDAEALVTIYEKELKSLEQTVKRWFAAGTEVRARAINSMLAAVARQAHTYDPHFLDASEWIHQCAEAEARRLRETLHGGSTKTLRVGRAT